METISILLVEDSEADTHLIKKAFQSMKIANDLHAYNNGKLALEYLIDKAENAPHELPDIILLDINMPQISGRNFLKQVKLLDSLVHIPVIMLTGSSNQKDIVDFYRLGASSYLVKPIEFENFLEIVKAIEGFWIKLVKFKDNGSTQQAKGEVA